MARIREVEETEHTPTYLGKLILYYFYFNYIDLMKMNNEDSCEKICMYPSYILNIKEE